MRPTGRAYHVISGDSHVVEPPDLWTRWLERKHHDQAPRLAKDDQGGDAWLLPGAAAPGPIGLVCVVGQRPEQMRWPGMRYGHDIDPSCHDGKARLKALDVDGVDAEIEYPTIAMRLIAQCTGKIPLDVEEACIRAYNRWLIEEFCAPDPARLIALPVIPPKIGVERSVAELGDAVKKGCRGVILTSWPTGGDTLSRADDAFWAAAQEARVPVSIHISLAGRASRGPQPMAAEAQWAVGADTFSGLPPIMTELMFTGTFDRFPALKVLAVETGAGWIPFFLEMLDDRYWRNRVWGKSSLKKIPSQYWRDHWLATFIVDRIGVQVRHAVGIDNLAWSTDFPHHGNDWPFSRRTIEEHFTDVPAEEREKIVCTNAARLYGLIA